MIPDLDGALECLGLNPHDPADATDIDTVTAIWSRRALGSLFGEQEPPIPEAHPALRLLPSPWDNTPHTENDRFM